ncbi:unnamed protein product [Clonostachys solani]|uniref:Uncharacterized protein n=1 Tax=Clonostachys solani TaxID=160281 RepID=A0A9N9Z9K6_9HYPO|nr:unnamed protein product [Clonostachys solani]
MVSFKNFSLAIAIVLGFSENSACIPLPAAAITCAKSVTNAGSRNCVHRSKLESSGGVDVVPGFHNRGLNLHADEDYISAFLRRRGPTKPPASPSKKSPSPSKKPVASPPKKLAAGPPKKSPSSPKKPVASPPKKPAAGPPKKSPSSPKKPAASSPQKAGKVCRRDGCSTQEIHVALYSQGAGNRVNPTTGHGRYHWGYLVGSRDGKAAVYHATDRNELNTKTWRMENPSGGWWFEALAEVNPWHSEKLLGRIAIGSVPAGVTADEIKALFEGVPLPVIGGVVQESCRTWVFNAMKVLQQKGWVSAKIDTKSFEEWGLSYADARTKSQRQPIETYPSQ